MGETKYVSFDYDLVLLLKRCMCNRTKESEKMPLLFDRKFDSGKDSENGLGETATFVR